MSRTLVEVRHLQRTFGTVRAVADLSFDIQEGQVVGFIGANGAGKTTTMRMMVTLEVPDAGTVRIEGRDVMEYPSEVRRLVGWMPDAYGAYDHVTVDEYLDFFARAYGYRGAERRTRVHEVMDFTDLAPLADRPMNTLSKGMGQRLCLGRTLLHDPPLLVLDEPAAGLDPKARVEFKHLVRVLAGEGKTLFISSHILSELEEMCDTLLFIDQGRLVHHGSADHLKRDHSGGVVAAVEVAGDPAPLAAWAEMSPGVALLELTRQGARLRLEDGGDEGVARVLRRLVQDGFAVTGFRREQVKLEDAFINLLRERAAASAAAAAPPPRPPGNGV